MTDEAVSELMEMARGRLVTEPMVGREVETLECPITGEVVRVDDVEAMIAMLDRVSTAQAELRAAEYELRDALGGLARGEGKTLRVMGEAGSVVRVERPDDSWDQATLRQAYEMPHGPTLIRIAQLAPDKRALKKAANTAGPEDFEAVKLLIESARRPPSRAPRVVIEALRGVKVGG